MVTSLPAPSRSCSVPPGCLSMKLLTSYTYSGGNRHTREDYGEVARGVTSRECVVVFQRNSSHPVQMQLSLSLSLSHTHTHTPCL